MAPPAASSMHALLLALALDSLLVPRASAVSQLRASDALRWSLLRLRLFARILTFALLAQQFFERFYTRGCFVARPRISRYFAIPLITGVL
jgi:hypothetical protein